MSQTADSKHEDILKERRKRIFSLRNLIFLIISLFLVYYLLKHIDFRQAFGLVKTVNPLYVIMSVALYFFSNYLKTLRFSLLLKKHSININTLYGIVSYQNFFNMILPARTGELTLIYYLKKLAGINISSGLYSLLFSRIVDLVVVASIFLLSSAVKWGLSFSPVLFVSAALVLAVSVCGMVKLDFFIKLMRTIINAVSSFFKMNNSAIVNKILAGLDSFYQELAVMHHAQSYFKILMVSIGIWLNLYLIFYYNIKAFVGAFNFNDVLIGATGAVLANVLPINSFGSIGTLQAGWTGGFLLVGMPASDAIITGFGSHFIMLGSAAFIAVLWKMYDTFIRADKGASNR